VASRRTARAGRRRRDSHVESRLRALPAEERDSADAHRGRRPLCRRSDAAYRQQSGHIILGDFSTTGDGLIAALQVLAAIIETDAPASQVGKVFEPVPQILHNVRCDGGRALQSAAVKKAIGAGEKRLGAAGRLLVRKSGTEPLLRIMAEGEDEALLNAVIEDIAEAALAAGVGKSAAE
jgi:phosphomannomutase